MSKTKWRYCKSFEIWGLLLFLIVMIPNFIWFAIPAPNDILRAESVTETGMLFSYIILVG